MGTSSLKNAITPSIRRECFVVSKSDHQILPLTSLPTQIFLWLLNRSSELQIILPINSRSFPSQLYFEINWGGGTAYNLADYNMGNSSPAWQKNHPLSPFPFLIFLCFIDWEMMHSFTRTRNLGVFLWHCICLIYASLINSYPVLLQVLDLSGNSSQICLLLSVSTDTSLTDHHL